MHVRTTSDLLSPVGWRRRLLNWRADNGQLWQSLYYYKRYIYSGSVPLQVFKIMHVRGRKNDQFVRD